MLSLLALFNSPLFKWISILVLLAGLVTACYTYVQITQNQIERLSKENSVLKIQVDQYKKAIEELKANFEKQRKVLDDLRDEMEQAGIPEEMIKKFFNETDLDNKTAEEIQKLLNEQQVDIDRCFEVMSGQPIKPGERNSVCPYLFEQL